MSIEIEVQYAVDDTEIDGAALPDESDFTLWINTALAGRCAAAQLTVRIVGAAESAKLNETYRQKLGPTNVLSFDYDCPEDLGLPLMGDLVICAPVVFREAKEQHKTDLAHWAHMVVHGSLHLLGFDHIDDNEASEMEALETDLLTRLGCPDPFAIEKVA